MGPAGSRRIPRAPRYSGAGLPQSSSFRVRASHPLRTHFPEGSATLMTRRGAGPTTPGAAAMHRPGLGSCAFARHYLRNHCYFLFLRVLRCFSSPGSPTASMRCDGIAPAGFPHSDIRGSRGICPSPRLFAACHVLRRLREPQASPMRPFCLSLMSFAFRPSLVSRIPDRGARTRSLFYTLYSVSSLRYQDSRHHRLGAATLLSSRSQHVNDLVSLFSVVPGRLELPTSTLSV